MSKTIANTGELKVTISTYKWKIKNFSITRNNVGECVHSSTFQTTCSNITSKWCLKLYPKGYSKEWRDYLSLYITYHGGIKVNSTITLSILDNKNNKVVSDIILKKSFNDGETRGFRKFISRRFLMNKSSDILKNDVLTIFCEISYISQIPTSNSTSKDNHEIVESEYEPQYRKELDDFEKLLVTENLSDVTFVIGENKIHLHKAILASRSPIFYAMFATEMREKHESKVVITDIKYEVMKEVLRFIYASRVNDIDKYSCDLLLAAEKYSIDGLKELCEMTLCRNLTVSNALEYLTLAGTCNSILLKLHVIEFIVSFPQIVTSPEFQFLDPDLMCEVTRAIVERNMQK